MFTIVFSQVITAQRVLSMLSSTHALLVLITTKRWLMITMTVYHVKVRWLTGKFSLYTKSLGRFCYPSSMTYMDRNCADIISHCVVLFPASCYPLFPNVQYRWKLLYTYSDNVLVLHVLSVQARTTVNV